MHSNIPAEAVEYAARAVHLTQSTKRHNDCGGIILAGEEKGFVIQSGRPLLAVLALVEAVHHHLVLHNPIDDITGQHQDLILPIINLHLLHLWPGRHAVLLELQVPNRPGHGEPGIDHGPTLAACDHFAPSLLYPFGFLWIRRSTMILGEGLCHVLPAKDGPAVPAVPDVEQVVVLDQADGGSGATGGAF